MTVVSHDSKKPFSGGNRENQEEIALTRILFLTGPGQRMHRISSGSNPTPKLRTSPAHGRAPLLPPRLYCRDGEEERSFDPSTTRLGQTDSGLVHLCVQAWNGPVQDPHNDVPYFSPHFTRPIFVGEGSASHVTCHTFRTTFLLLERCLRW